MFRNILRMGSIENKSCERFGSGKTSVERAYGYIEEYY